MLYRLWFVISILWAFCTIFAEVLHGHLMQGLDRTLLVAVAPMAAGVLARSALRYVIFGPLR